MTHLLVWNYRLARRLWKRHPSARTRRYAFWSQDRLAHRDFATAKRETWRK